MSPSRRDLISSSVAITFVSISKASAQVQKTIGVATTIKLQKTDEEFLCFKAGLLNQGWQETGGGAKKVILPDPKEAHGNYGGSFTTSYLRGLINSLGHADLVGAVGGVISRLAASQELTGPSGTIPYVYLSGMAPSPPATAGKYSGIILNTPARYADARAKLVPASPGDVWLVQNNNSAMTPDETKAWRTGFRNDRDFRFFQNPPADNNTNFSGEVTKLMANNPKGLVISPDAFFRMENSAFTAAMSGLNVPICYPFKDYQRRATDQLLAGGAVLSTPTLDQGTAYWQFGNLAGQFLNDPSALHPALTWTWNGTAGQWL